MQLRGFAKVIIKVNCQLILFKVTHKFGCFMFSQIIKFKNIIFIIKGGNSFRPLCVKNAK